MQKPQKELNDLRPGDAKQNTNEWVTAQGRLTTFEKRYPGMYMLNFFGERQLKKNNSLNHKYFACFYQICGFFYHALRFRKFVISENIDRILKQWEKWSVHTFWEKHYTPNENKTYIFANNTHNFWRKWKMKYISLSPSEKCHFYICRCFFKKINIKNTIDNESATRIMMINPLEILTRKIAWNQKLGETCQTCR